MKSFGLLLLLLFFLFGCATDQAAQKKAEGEYLATIPSCHNDNQCRNMWSAAQTWVAKNSALKIYSSSETMIQTYYPPKGCANLGYKVTKEPQGPGSYRFIIQVICRAYFGCIPEKFEAPLNFNKDLNRFSKAS
jgi:hypothetical protein